MTVPAKALAVLEPKDYFHCVNYEGNIEELCYSFGSDTYFNVKNWASGAVYGGFGCISLYDVNSQQPYLFRIYPLGSSFVPGENMSGVVLDISDFKSKSVFEVKQKIRIDYQGFYYAQSYGETSFYFQTTGFACFYDKDGNFISQSVTEPKRTDVTLYGNDTEENYIGSEVIELDMPFVIPEDAVYMAPCLLTYLYPPPQHAPHMITDLEVSSHDFYVQILKNLLIEQSETMEAIDDQLGDLNDKADSILNGDQHQQSNAQDGSDKVDQNQAAMDDVLADLDQYDKLDPTSGMEAIQNFLQEDGWLDVKQLISPLLEWGPTVTIMLIVLSLINLSVILFGR